MANYSGDHIAASKNPEILRRSLDRLAQAITRIGVAVGKDPFANLTPDASGGQTETPPATTGISVAGQDGFFYVTITPPVQGVDRQVLRAQVDEIEPDSDILGVRGPRGTFVRRRPMKEITRRQDFRQLRRMYHNLQSATASSFDASSNLVDYGTSEKVQYTIQDPNITRVWRVRSRYENSDFGPWIYFTSALTCGVIAVWSGILRTSSLSQINGAASYIGASNPITQHGVTTQIDVAASTWAMGAQTLSYGSGSVDPGVYGKFYVYVVDTKRTGGALVYHVASNPGTLTTDDGVVYLGSITTAGGGGGTGSGGGGGPCLIGACLLDLVGGGTVKQSEVRAGDTIAGIDGQAEVIQDIELIPDQPYMQVTLDNGFVVQGCTLRHPFKLATGGWAVLEDLNVGDELRVRGGAAAKITGIQYVGRATVYRMTLSRTRAFIGDGIIQHNANFSSK